MTSLAAQPLSTRLHLDSGPTSLHPCKLDSLLDFFILFSQSENTDSKTPLLTYYELNPLKFGTWLITNSV